MKLYDLMYVMQGSKYNTYPRIWIADYGTGGGTFGTEGDFGYVDDVLNLKNDEEYSYLLDAEVTGIDFTKCADGSLCLDIEVQS